MADMIQAQLMTVAEFAAFENRPENRERTFELIHGEPVEQMVTQLHAQIAGNLVFALKLYLKTHPIGWVGPAISIRIPNYDERKPDVAFFTAEGQPTIEDTPATTMPALAVEIKSPTNTYTELRDEAAYYLQHGAKLVWLVYPEKRLVEIFSAGGEVDILTNTELLSGRDVLPDFTLPVSEVFGV